MDDAPKFEKSFSPEAATFLQGNKATQDLLEWLKSLDQEYSGILTELALKKRMVYLFSADEAERVEQLMLLGLMASTLLAPVIVRLGMEAKQVIRDLERLDEGAVQAIDELHAAVAKPLKPGIID